MNKQSPEQQEQLVDVSGYLPSFFDTPIPDVDESEQLAKLYYEDHPNEEASPGLLRQFLSLVACILTSTIIIIVLVYPSIMIVSLTRMLLYPISRGLQRKSFIHGFINPLLGFILSTCVISVLVITFDPKTNVNGVSKLILIKVIWLFCTQILVIANIRNAKNLNKTFTSYFNIAEFVHPANIQSYVIQLSPQASSDMTMDLDQNIETWVGLYKNSLAQLQIELHSQQFNCLLNRLRSPKEFAYRGFQLLLNANKFIPPQTAQFLFIALIVLSKVVLVVHFTPKPLEHIIFIALTTAMTLNVSFTIAGVFQNNDLRRKKLILSNLNDSISLCGGVKKMDMLSKIDVTSEASLITWNCTRRAVYVMFEGDTTRLEAAYNPMFLLYFILILLLISAFGNVSFLFDKETSIMMTPLMLLFHILDFLLISKLLLSRLFEGQKFNDLFEDTVHRLDALRGKFEDLCNQYDYYFTKRSAKMDENNFAKIIDQQEGIHKDIEEGRLAKQIDFSSNGENKQQPNIYDILAAKVKENAMYYVEKKECFQGDIYEKDRAYCLHLRMMKSIIETIERAKISVQSDVENHDYKFLNLIHLNFSEAINTIMLTLVSAGPALFPQIISLFKQK